MAGPLTSPDKRLVSARATALAYHSLASFLRERGIRPETQQQQLYGTGLAGRFGQGKGEEVSKCSALSNQ
jgi:hypothetical protein